jgi:hypothetical protein
MCEQNTCSLEKNIAFIMKHAGVTRERAIKGIQDYPGIDKQGIVVRITGPPPYTGYSKEEKMRFIRSLYPKEEETEDHKSFKQTTKNE